MPIQEGCNKAADYYNNFFDGPMRMFRMTKWCDPFYPYYDVNTVKDYRTLENQQDPGQVSIRQNVNSRHVRIENNSKKDVLIGINLYRLFDYRPKPQFLLRGGEVRDLAIAMPGERIQYMWTYDPASMRTIGDPHPLRWNINTFVINEGQNRFWVMDFYHKGYRGQI